MPKKVAKNKKGLEEIPPSSPEPEPAPPVVREKGLYNGERKNGQRDGDGSYYFYSNGARYFGDWEKGMKHGNGTFVYPDSSRYEGQWYQNKRHGYGCYYYTNGDTYNGQWMDNAKHGNGRYYSATTKNFYVGSWVQGKMCGRTQVLADNLKFSGEFQEGKPNGPGVFVLPENKSVSGYHELRGKKQATVWVTTGIEESYPSTSATNI